MQGVRHIPRPTRAIKAKLLLQVANGREDIPGLYEALERGTPVPAELPQRHLSREEFLQDHVVPWLAGRLRRGAALDDVLRDYQQCAAPAQALGMNCGHPQIERGIAALAFAPLRDILQYHDDALGAALCVGSQAGASGLFIRAQCYPAQPEMIDGLISDVWQVAAHLATRGPVLHLNWPRLRRPMTLAPVIEHLTGIAQALEASVDSDDELAERARAAGKYGRREMLWAVGG